MRSLILFLAFSGVAYGSDSLDWPDTLRWQSGSKVAVFVAPDKEQRLELRKMIEEKHGGTWPAFLPRASCLFELDGELPKVAKANRELIQKALQDWNECLVDLTIEFEPSARELTECSSFVIIELLTETERKQVGLSRWAVALPYFIPRLNPQTFNLIAHVEFGVMKLQTEVFEHPHLLQCTVAHEWGHLMGIREHLPRPQRRAEPRDYRVRHIMQAGAPPWCRYIGLTKADVMMAEKRGYKLSEKVQTLPNEHPWSRIDEELFRRFLKIQQGIGNEEQAIIE